MGQLAMRAVGLGPLVEQGQDLGDFGVEQPVHRRPVRCLVGQLPQDAPRDPAVRANLAEFEFVAGAAQRPAGVDRVIEQAQQRRLGGRVDPVWDPAT